MNMWSFLFWFFVVAVLFAMLRYVAVVVGVVVVAFALWKLYERWQNGRQPPTE